MLNSLVVHHKSSDNNIYLKYAVVKESDLSRKNI